MQKTIAIPLCLVFWLIFSSTQTNAQWKQVAPPSTIIYKDAPTSGAISYSNGNLWAAGAPGANLKTDIWFSPDTGKTWRKQASLPNFMTTDLRFANEHAGFITGCGFDASSGISGGPDGGIYVTIDQGLTWLRPYKSKYMYTVAPLESDQHILAYGPSGLGFKESNIGGGSWYTPSASQFGYTNREIYCLASNASANRVCFFEITSEQRSNKLIGQFFGSTDNGSTWSKGGSIYDWDSFGLTIDSCNPDIVYVANEAWKSGDDSSDILVSKDFGKTWKKTFSDRTRDIGAISGSIATSEHAVYFQTMSKGIFRSTDQGETWVNIGGPSAKYDTRVLAVIDDNILVAGDLDGSIWMTDNSGGDPVRFSPTVDTASYVFSSAKIINDSSGVTVRLPMFLRHSGLMPDVDMIMHYPAGPLQYLSAALVSGRSIDVAGNTWPGRVKLHFNGNDLNGLSDSLVGYVSFKWMPTEFDCAFITFDSITSASAQHCNTEILVSNPFKGIIGAYEWCGQSAVAPHVQAQLNFTIVPNPSHGKFTISSIDYSGAATITLFDELGKTVLTTDRYIDASATVLDAMQLAAGTYFLRIETPQGKMTYMVKVIE